MFDIDTARSEGAVALGTGLRRCLERRRSAGDAGDFPLTFVIRPLSGAADAAQVSKEASRTDVTVCHISYDAARVVIGPIVRRGLSPCLRCAQLWAPNLRQGDSDLALPAPLTEVLAAQVMAYADCWLDNPDTVPMPIWWVDVDTFERSTQRLSPHPECEVCGRVCRAPTTFMAGERQVSADTWRAQVRPDSTVLAERLVDSRFGLVRQFERETEALAHPMTFAAFVGRGDPRQLEIGVGRSGCQALDRDIATLEALERFSSFRPRGPIETVTARYSDISSIASNPRSFILPDAEQREEPGFTLAAFDPNATYEWTWAHSLRRGTRVLIPLQLAYYDLPPNRLPATQRFVFETSNGCALGASTEEAALFGLFEVLERDAYLTTWYGRLIPERLHVDDVGDPHIAGMLARIEAAGFTVHVLDVGVGFPITTVAVLAVDARAEAPAASHLSTGAHLISREALRGALVEVCTRIQRRPAAIVATSHARAAAMLLDNSLVRSMDDHASLYASPQSLPRLEFLTAGTHESAISRVPMCDPGAKADGNEKLRVLADAVLKVADDVLVVDLSNALTHSVGLHCVKVLAPGLLPVTFGHQYRRVSAERIALAAGATNRVWEGRGTYLPHNFQ